jgi:small-conductance mechanosensitive channel
MATRAIITDSAVPWIAAALLTQPLAPTRPALRWVPLTDEDARWMAAVIRRSIVIGAGSWLVAETLFLLWVGDGLPRLIVIAGAAIVAALIAAALLRVRHRVAGFMRLWHALAAIGVVVLPIAWTLDLVFYADPPFLHGLGTLSVLGAAALADGAASVLVERAKRRFTRRAARTRTIFAPSPSEETEVLLPVAEPIPQSERQAEAAEMARSLDGFAGVLHEAVMIAVLIGAAVLLARIWSVDLAAILGSIEERHFAGRLVDAGVTILIGWYVWRLFEAGLEVQISRDVGVQSRARTVQPLLRSIGKLVVGATVLMTALSGLGFNIAPLVASAGVVGIAIGFGAQTLVRDLFSGAFYLIEDVFRVGDYIEGGNAKGTVERITFRTVALRHQNGPLHFVPYGTLGSVRNNSRDWVIDKFQIPLPVEVDSEQIRKMVKKIGEAMLEDPELKPLIMMPLKAKLYRIDPGAKIFRCKVQTPPNKQFEVRADAYRRIETALRKAGIPFADPAPRVTVNNMLAREDAAAAPAEAETLPISLAERVAG